MSADIYSQIAELSSEREHIRREIEEKTAPLRARLHQVEERLDAMAATLVASKRATAEASPAAQVSGETYVAQLEEVLVDLPAVPPRRRKLLELVRDKPDGDLGYFAQKMYGDPGQRGSISAEFSYLKADELVESPVRGRFRITHKGLAVLTRATGGKVLKTG